MLNPFERFQGRFIEAFRKAGKSFLVSQTFNSAKDPFADEEKQYILFSHYGTLSHAQIHLSALKGDKWAAILDLEKEKHRDKILDMLRADSDWVVFSSLIASKESVEKRLNLKYEKNMRRYIEKNTNWRIGGDKTIYPQLDIAFGELFIILKYGSQQIRIKLEELDKA
ncbi:MAG TPA: hypothetical protein VK543_11865 [Puia sp.]|nr:hypothetical protein [Puia sp.]